MLEQGVLRIYSGNLAEKKEMIGLNVINGNGISENYIQIGDKAHIYYKDMHKDKIIAACRFDAATPADRYFINNSIIINPRGYDPSIKGINDIEALTSTTTILTEKVNAAKFFEHSDIKYSDEFKDVFINCDKTDELRYFKTYNPENIAFHMLGKECIGYVRLVHNSYLDTVIMLMKTYPTKDEDGYFLAIDCKSGYPIDIYQFTVKDTNQLLLRDVPIDKDGVPILENMTYKCPAADDKTEIIVQEGEDFITYTYRPAYIYEGDWDLPSELVYEDMICNEDMIEKTGVRMFRRRVFEYNEEDFSFLSSVED